ncbi:MAG: polynucleotide adenylyltransferase PcnB [Deltaproteobacteria bacterium]|nr:polynucleotide adenylyltransferase PcnB [Deltaproteobacteria bacterium]MBN2674396.1 polynucleotide adenylyltransferase PcnB [Deltaproteobacteria bacterium]
MNATPESLPTVDLLGPCPSDVRIVPERRLYSFDPELLDIDALKVVRRLKRFGYQAYLVGGCVRDLLLGAQPKDFDVVTSARPAEIKQLFRNCRLIGRRFRLAHLHFKNQKIIEVATFRREPTAEDDLSSRHAAQNLFGNEVDDAIRRDFTVNALMYDVEAKEILDWVGGLADVESRTIRAIGEPQRRLPEDPVRILRAVKFAKKLDLRIESELYAEMSRFSPLIAECSKARLLEEMFKVLRSGYGATCLAMLHDIGALAHILPGLDTSIQENGNASFALLEQADIWNRNHRNVSDALLLGALLYPALETCIWEAQDVSKALSAAFKPLVHPLQFTKKNMATVRYACVVQRRMLRGPRNRRVKKLVDRDYALEAVDLLELSGKAPAPVVEQWRQLIASRMTQKKPAPGKPRARRRRPPVKRTRTLKTSDGVQTAPKA